MIGRRQHRWQAVRVTDGERFGPELELLRSRVLDLPLQAQAVLALAPAQRVVRASGDGSTDMEEVLNVGWSVVQSGQEDCAACVVIWNRETTWTTTP